ncbi:MAG TPA: nuclear transport factor 2 family protein [Streptosporangiaceae bacterium]|nr:nuclear transport factor 2 family protein [Streptosporangiaceae bacterium]
MPSQHPTAMTAADDRDEIRTLVHSYADRIDRGDIDGVVELFAHASVVSSEGHVISGRKMLRELWATGLQLYDGSPRTHHLITNVDVRVSDDGQRATANSYATAVQALPGFPLQVIVASRHEDTFEKVNGRWRFAERRDFRDLEGDLSRHFVLPHRPESD